MSRNPCARYLAAGHPSSLHFPEVTMQRATPPNSNAPWSTWKREWVDNLKIASVAAGLEAGTFALFLFMFTQDPHRLFPVVAGSLAVFWVFNVGVSALNSYLCGHSKVKAPPPDLRAG